MVRDMYNITASLLREPTYERNSTTKQLLRSSGLIGLLVQQHVLPSARPELEAVLLPQLVEPTVLHHLPVQERLVRRLQVQQVRNHKLLHVRAHARPQPDLLLAELYDCVLLGAAGVRHHDVGHAIVAAHEVGGLPMDVQGLDELLALEDVQPPLAVGLGGVQGLDHLSTTPLTMLPVTSSLASAPVSPKLAFSFTIGSASSSGSFSSGLPHTSFTWLTSVRALPLPIAAAIACPLFSLRLISRRGSSAFFISTPSCLTSWPARPPPSSPRRSWSRSLLRSLFLSVSLSLLISLPVSRSL
eukprot:CAMPEP_0173171284 /NCGR_PEP_ID=MMETSP1141-20130122/1681_1 /TAXON_ID=483371 /ORGANISM="non described non described, Strain CCMP2298" /LENGTH=299 /DNA_ID=CAMNT_0014093219 /DNA_START=389 /DNA_END=1289 /DNA_ORIENTATION=+